MYEVLESEEVFTKLHHNDKLLLYYKLYMYAFMRARVWESSYIWAEWWESIFLSEDGDDNKYYFSRDQAWEMLLIKVEERTNACSVNLTHSIQLKK